MKKSGSKRFFVLLLVSVLLGCAVSAEAAGTPWRVTAAVDTYSISGETMVRAGTGPCGQDEYLSLVYTLSNSGSDEAKIKKIYTRIDGGDRLEWQGNFTMKPGESTRLHVYYQNMARLAAGSHKCVLYINDKVVFTQTVEIPRSWEAALSLPSAAQISAVNREAKGRSPYIGAWLQVGNVKYTEYAIDMKADYLPNGTYVCAANWHMDFSSLLKQYARVEVDYDIAGYGGLQKWDDGSTHAILSLWDIYCKDKKGNLVKTIQPTQVYPAPNGKQQRFTGEGTGGHTLPECPFEAGKWYRLLFTCTPSKETGTTVVTEYVIDLETNTKTKMAAFDTGVKNACFRGDIAVFLENYETQFSGEVRTAEYRNARIKLKKDGTWKNVNKISFDRDTSHEGSFRYGSDGRQFWIITTGVGSKTQKDGTFTVKNQEKGKPY